MPTERPRITITLTPEIHRSLTSAAKVMRRSKGSLVLELLEQSRPFLDAAAVIEQGLLRFSESDRKKVVEHLAGLEKTAGSLASTGLAGIDLFLGMDSRSDSENPPPPNRGGSFPSVTAQKPKKGAKPATNVVSLKARRGIENAR